MRSRDGERDRLRNLWSYRFLVMSLYKESILDAMELLQDNDTVPASSLIYSARYAMPPFRSYTETEYKHVIAEHIGKCCNMIIHYCKKTDTYSLTDYRNYN